MKEESELKTCKSYDCLDCAWQSSNKPYKMRCPDCGSVVESHKQNKPSLIDRPTPPVQAKTAEEITIEKFIELNNYQPFELWPDLTEVIQHAAGHWKTDREWSYLLEQINKVCLQAFHAKFTSTAKSVEVEEAAEIKVFETNLSLGYNELAYIVHYRNNDYLCIGIKSERVTNSYAVGCLSKFADHEIKYFQESKFKIEDSPLWNDTFANWLVDIYLPNWQQQKQAETIIRLTESLKTIYSLAKPGSAIYDICDKTLNQKP